jgi:hypothetical protein
MAVVQHHGSEAACVADKNQGTKDDGESYKAKMSQEQWTSDCKKSDTVSPGQDSADHFLPKVSVDAGTPSGGSGSWLGGVERVAGAVVSAVAEDAKHAASAVVDFVEHPVAAAEKVGQALGDELSKGPAQVLADVGAGVGHAAQWVSQHPVETVALAGAAALGIVTAGTASPVLAALAAAGAAGTAHSVINSGERVSEHTRELSILWNPEGHSSQELGEAARTIGSDVSGAIDMVLVTAGTVGLGAVGGKVLAAVRGSGQAAKEARAAEVAAGQAAAEPTKGLARASTGASAAPTDAAAQGSGAASAPATDAAAQGSGASSPAPTDAGVQAQRPNSGDSATVRVVPDVQLQADFVDLTKVHRLFDLSKFEFMHRFEEGRIGIAGDWRIFDHDQFPSGISDGNRGAGLTAVKREDGSFDFKPKEPLRKLAKPGDYFSFWSEEKDVGDIKKLVVMRIETIQNCTDTSLPYFEAWGRPVEGGLSAVSRNEGVVMPKNLRQE